MEMHEVKQFRLQMIESDTVLTTDTQMEQIQNLTLQLQLHLIQCYMQNGHLELQFQTEYIHD